MNRERRNGIILSSSQKTYGKYTKKPKYNLNNLIVDISNNSNNNNSSFSAGFDISNDSIYDTQDISDSDPDDFGDAQIINIAISDDEDLDHHNLDDVRTSVKTDTNNDISGIASPLHSQEMTPKKASNKRKSVLQDISPIVNNSGLNSKEERKIQMTSPPASFQRNSSAGLSQFRNRNSTISNGSKRWSLLSFNNDDINKENIPSSNSIHSNSKNKRFSIASAQSFASSLRENNGSNANNNNNNKSKRFSMSSTQSTSSSNSIKIVLNKVGNALSTVSVSSLDDSNESTPYKNCKPGVVGEKPLSVPAPVLAPVTAVAPTAAPEPEPVSSSVKTAPRGNRIDYTKAHSLHQKQSTRDFDAMSMNSRASGSSLRSSRSIFRLSSIFSNKKPTQQGDNESLRSIKTKSSLNDIRKSVLTLSPSRSSLFRLSKKDSIGDLKHHQLDKTMISLPKPDNNSREKLKSRLQKSSSIISINSIISRQQPKSTPPTSSAISKSTPPTSSFSNSSKASSSMSNLITTNEYESQQLKNLLGLTSIPKIMNFKDYISTFSNLNNQYLCKYAEASYSEVFCVKNIEGNDINKILKIIPFGGDENLDQPSVDNIVQELKINLKLQNKKGFIKLKDSFVVKGSYPNYLLRLWDDFNEFKKSLNFRPEFEINQKFLIMEFEFGGIDLENFKIKSFKDCTLIFWEIVKILNNAEKQFKFEHRDLHWGNIVIKEILERHSNNNDNNDNDITNDTSEGYMVEEFKDLSIIEETDESPDQYHIKRALEVKLIDFTLSRLDDVENDQVIFTRLDHQDFFKGCGDYQFDIYRFMRNAIIQQSGEDKEIDWSKSCLQTNIYWLHYLLDKMLHNKKIPDQKNQYYKDLQFIYKSLDPRRKKLNESTPNFKKKNVKSKKKQVLFFSDFHSCQDVLDFGEFYELIVNQ